MSQFHTRFNAADKAILEVRTVGGSTVEFVPGISDWTRGGGDPEQTDVRTLHDIDRAAGPHTPETFGVTIAGWQFSGAYNTLRDAFSGNNEVQVRLRQPNEYVHFPATTGITLQFTQSTSALVAAPTTLVGHPNTGATSKIGVGSSIKWTGDETSGVQNYRTIKSVAANGQITGVTFENPPSADIAAATYAVVQSPWYINWFNARVGSLPETGAVSGAVSGSINFVVLSDIPKVVNGLTS